MPAMGVRWCCLCPRSVKTSLQDLKDGQLRHTQEFIELAKPVLME